jgi:hypothetical protein
MSLILIIEVYFKISGCLTKRKHGSAFMKKSTDEIFPVHKLVCIATLNNVANDSSSESLNFKIKAAIYTVCLHFLFFIVVGRILKISLQDPTP